MTDTTPAPAAELPPEAPPLPAHAPDVHLRVREVRLEWWRRYSTPNLTTTEAAQDEPQPPVQEGVPGTPGPRQDILEEAPEDSEGPGSEDRTHQLRRSHKSCHSCEEEAPEEGTSIRNRAASSRRASPPATSPGRTTGSRSANPGRQALFDCWARRDRKQRFVLLNGSAGATGMYGYGMFTGRWDIGLPQTVLGWMNDLDASTTEAAAPLMLGVFAVLGAAIVGSHAFTFLTAVIPLPSAQAVLHWLLVRMPVSSAAAAVALFSSA